MITKASVAIAVLAGLCFGGSFLGTVATRSQTTTAPAHPVCSPLTRRLGLDAEQAKLIQAHDPQFAGDMRVFREKLEEARSMLAVAFENESATDDEIRTCVEVVIEAHNQLERRVAEYLIAVRDHLTPEQRKQLCGLCARKVRECGRRWRHRQGRHGDELNDNASHEQRGRGCGRGRGRN
ncbi:MAG: periplasmic heavy metal sensor [Phycisphaerae bacterium]|nr:periplasmic heavy metal sensor [Phycisphaerae bacterium]